MQIHPHPIALAASATPSSSSAPGSALQSDDDAFAKLLSARQAEPRHEAAPPAAEKSPQASEPPPADAKGAKPTDDADDAASERSAGAPQPRAAPARQQRGETRGNARAVAQPRKTADENVAAPSADAKDTPSASHDKAKLPFPARPEALADWIATLNRPVQPTLPAGTGADTTTAADDGAANASVKGKAVPLADLLAARADAAQADARDRPTPSIEQPGERLGFDAAMLDAIKESAAPAQRFVRSAGIDAAAPNVAGASSPAPRADAPAAPIAVDIPTPATAPEFRAALGVQVSVLARDGVQHAQLHLNPAEMGPISVQIALDGTQARVDFGADSAATRQLIEAGLPELAAALRDAGLTLSGGGVSQHSQSNGNEPQSRGHGMARRGDGDAADVEPARVNLRLPLGAIDLYA